MDLVVFQLTSQTDANQTSPQVELATLETVVILKEVGRHQGFLWVALFGL